MRKATTIVTALGLFGIIGLTPVTGGPAANTDRSTEFKLAQAQDTGATKSSTSKSKSKKVAKKPKPKKKQRYERSN
jgi:hypothetical protein